MPKKTKAMTKKEETALQAFDYGDDAGAGYENQTAADISVPFLAILQSNSPQVQEDNPAGSKSGLLFNTVTEDLHESVIAVPAHTERLFVEWRSRDQGGGFVGIHQVDSDFVNGCIAASTEFGKYTTPEGNQLTETFQVYWAMVNADRQPIGMFTTAFTSTKIKVYKDWNTRIRGLQLMGMDGTPLPRPPIFAHSVCISTVLQKNPKGSFFNFTLGPAGKNLRDSLLAPGCPAFEAGKNLRDLVIQGLKRADYESTRAEGDTTEDAPF